MTEDLKNDIVLLRLINNDRLIGQVVKLDQELIALYAPMLVEYNDGTFDLSVYDPLSDTAMAIFDHDCMMTITIPKSELEIQYKNERELIYPSLESLRKKLIEDVKEKYGDNFFDAKKIQDMFSDIVNNSLPIDKSKLN